MIFRTDIEPSCSYCKHGCQVSPDRVACLKRGIVSIYDACPKFAYDPLKRRPERPRKLAASDGDEPFTL